MSATRKISNVECSGKLCYIAGDIEIDFQSLIGEGSFGKVYKAINKITKDRYAAKVINLKDTGMDVETEEKFTKNIPSEISILMSLDHPNITRTVMITQDDEKVVIYSGLYDGGNVFSLTKDFPSNDCTSFYLFSQAVAAVKYLHDKNIVHRDIKEENMLIKSKEDLKLVLIDFGVSRIVSTENPMIEYFQGTLEYSPLEVLTRIPFNGFKSDIWALGVFLYNIIYGVIPFDGINIKEIIEKLRRYNPPMKRTGVSFPPHIDLVELLSGMLDKNEKTRYSIDDVIKSKWFQTWGNLVNNGIVTCGYDDKKMDLPDSVSILIEKIDNVENCGGKLCSIKDDIEIDFNSLLRKGTFGEIYKAVNVKNHKDYEVEIINEKDVRMEHIRDIENQIEISMDIVHPNVVRTKMFIHNHMGVKLYTDLYESNILELIMKQLLTLNETFFIFSQMVAGVKYLHENKIVHRDIKLDNFLYRGKYEVALANFWVAVNRDPRGPLLKEKVYQPLQYASPEIIQLSKIVIGYDGYKSDIWALGVCLYAILVGKYTSGDITDRKGISEFILNGTPSYERVPEKGAISLLEGMLKKNPRERFSIDNVINNEWFQKQLGIITEKYEVSDSMRKLKR